MNQNADFLLNNCGPIIRYLISKRSDASDPDFLKPYYKEVLKSPEVSYWKSKIPTTVEVSTVLGSSDSCFENSFAKLLWYELATEDIVTKQQLNNYLRFLENRQNSTIYDWLARYVVAGYLFASGYLDEKVTEMVKKRIDVIYDFVVNSPLKYNIHAAQYKGKKAVRSELYTGYELVLPLIYDVFIFYYIYDRVSSSLRKKIQKIVEYIADDRYQSLDYGYGLVKTKDNRTHFMGWSAHLPFYNDALSIPYFNKFLIQRMILFSRFDDPKINVWLGKMKKKLENFKISDDKYNIPSEFLTEKKNVYFLTGGHMRLGEPRKKRNSRIVESTFFGWSLKSS